MINDCSSENLRTLEFWSESLLLKTSSNSASERGRSAFLGVYMMTSDEDDEKLGVWRTSSDAEDDTLESYEATIVAEDGRLGGFIFDERSWL